jgi:hypothetical protein
MKASVSLPSKRSSSSSASNPVGNDAAVAKVMRRTFDDRLGEARHARLMFAYRGRQFAQKGRVQFS